MGQATAADWIVAAVALAGFAQSLAALVWQYRTRRRVDRTRLKLEARRINPALVELFVTYQADDRSLPLQVTLRPLDGVAVAWNALSEGKPNLDSEDVGIRDDGYYDLHLDPVSPEFSGSAFLVAPERTKGFRVRVTVHPPWEWKRPVFKATRLVIPHRIEPADAAKVIV